MGRGSRLKRQPDPQNKYRGVAQLASALAWGARGRLFESDHPDKSKMRLSKLPKALFFMRIFW